MFAKGNLSTYLYFKCVKMLLRFPYQTNWTCQIENQNKTWTRLKLCCSVLISSFNFNVITFGDKFFLPHDEYRSAGHQKKWC